MLSQISVYPIRIRLHDLQAGGIHGSQFFLGNASKPKGSQDLVGLHPPFTEHFCQSSRSDVPPEVHLPETVLGMYIPLGEEQVVRIIGVNMRDAK